MNKDRKTTQVRPTREDMLAYVANGRQRPNSPWAICVSDRTDRAWAICVSDRGER